MISLSSSSSEVSEVLGSFNIIRTFACAVNYLAKCFGESAGLKLVPAFI